MVGDRECVGLLLHELLKEQYVSGVIVDGFLAPAFKPTSSNYSSAKCPNCARPSSWALWSCLPPPIFRITVLFVDEKTSIERQLSRGHKIKAHNDEVERTGEGDQGARTDLDEEAALTFRTFQEANLPSTEDLRKYLLVNAQAPWMRSKSTSSR